VTERLQGLPMREAKISSFVTATLVNLEDLFQFRRGDRSPDEVRSITVLDAIARSGTTGLMVPKNLIDRLGLRSIRVRRARTADGIRTVTEYQAVKLEIAGRECSAEVYEAFDGRHVVIGSVLLVTLDLVIGPDGRLIGDPFRHGKDLIDAL
jgi:predicted aspartyl protease